MATITKDYFNMSSSAINGSTTFDFSFPRTMEKTVPSGKVPSTSSGSSSHDQYNYISQLQERPSQTYISSNYLPSSSYLPSSNMYMNELNEYSTSFLSSDLTVPVSAPSELFSPALSNSSSSISSSVNSNYQYGGANYLDSPSTSSSTDTIHSDNTALSSCSSTMTSRKGSMSSQYMVSKPYFSRRTSLDSSIKANPNKWNSMIADHMHYQQQQASTYPPQNNGPAYFSQPYPTFPIYTGYPKRSSFLPPLVRGLGCTSTSSKARHLKSKTSDSDLIPVELKITGLTDFDILSHWTPNEIADGRRIIRFERYQTNQVIEARVCLLDDCNPELEEDDYLEVSCLRYTPVIEKATSQSYANSAHFCITSVEVIKIVELLVGVHSHEIMPSSASADTSAAEINNCNQLLYLNLNLNINIETTSNITKKLTKKRKERGRIRSNLIHFFESKPISKTHYRHLFERVMNYTERKPRGFDKEIKIMKWENLNDSLIRAMQSYYVEGQHLINTQL